MTIGWKLPRKTIGAVLLAGIAAGSLASPALAQDDARVRRLEAEVRALQRAVFPNGGGDRFFTPEVTAGSPPAQPAISSTTPSAGALTDMLARLDALESQLARLTAQSEEKDNALAQLQRRFADAEARLAATAPAPTPAVQPSGLIPLPALTPTPSPSQAARPAPTPTPSSASAVTRPTPGPTPAAAPAPTAARLAAVRAIAKPATDDAGDDEYSYGYRLWEAGYFAEARQQLSLFLQRYPRHERVSYGRNLLGRAYLDDGQPREAAKYFFENYQADKNGARSADSLLFLAETMIAIADNSRACIALAEFGDTYPALATGRLKEQYDRTRNKVRCTT